MSQIMSPKTISCALFITLFLFISKLTNGQDIPFKIKQESIRSKNERLKLKPEIAKINTILYRALNRIAKNGMDQAHGKYQAATQNDFSPNIDIDESGRLHVTLRTTEITSSLLSALRKLNFEVESSTQNLNITPNHHFITGWIHFNHVEKIAHLEQIFHIRPVDKPMMQSGDVLTKGDAILRADSTRIKFNIDGSGEKVGIISDGCDHLSNSQASGDLPSSVELINNRFGGDEGTAMMEIVHDLAPGASLAFADRGNSQSDFVNNIELLKEAGCTIICDDILFPLEPVFEDGIIAQTIEEVVKNNDVVYISSAGDYRLNHHEGEFEDSDNDGWQNFAANDETINIQLEPGAEIRAVLQWNNQFGKAGDDYDLYLYDEQLNLELASSQDTQDGDDDPVEMVSYKNTRQFPITIHLCIKKFSGQNRELSIYAFGAGVKMLQHQTDGSIYGHPGAENCMAVGAIDASDSNNDEIESFSSYGPTRIYTFDVFGNPTSFVDRNKPDHAAIDGIQTKAGQLGFFTNPFFGTSAAAAHSAGIAALIREAAPYLSVAQVKDVINNTAIDLGTSGFDIIFGYGRIDAYEAVSYLKGDGPDIAVNPDSFDVALERGSSKTEIMTIHNNGGSELNFSITWQPLSSMQMSEMKSSIQTDLKTATPKSSTSYGFHKKAPLYSLDNSSQTSETSYLLNSSSILVYESFEDGIMPPDNWTKIDGPSTPGGSYPAHWHIDSTDYIFSGFRSAVCYWGYNLDEWLITPPLDFSSIISPAISFWWLGSYYWNVFPNDNGDLFVKISVDGGTTWETLWTFGDIGFWEDFEWYYTIINLSNFRGYSDVRIAFNVMANNNADIAIDEVVISGEAGNPNWLTINPTSGNLASGSNQDIQLIFNSVSEGDTLDFGSYFGEITISSNDLDQPNVLVPVELEIFNQSDIKGKLKYYTNKNIPVKDANVRLSGDKINNTKSDNDGGYQFLNLKSGSYTVLPQKSNDKQEAIDPYDASLILQAVVGLITLSPYQKIAADVTGNGDVTSYDASQILRYSVGQINRFPVHSDWTFIPHDFLINDDNWSTSPRSRNYSLLQSDQLDQNYFGILYGDVSGNWGNATSSNSDKIVELKIDNVQRVSPQKLILPIELKFFEDAHSGVIELKFNNQYLKFASCSIDKIKSDEVIFASSNLSDQVNVGFASGQSLNQKDLSLKLVFDELKGDESSVIEFKVVNLIIDEKSAMPAITNTSHQTERNVPNDWHLCQNHPNPFNAQTIIQYHVLHSLPVKIEVFNLLGQRIRVLVDNETKNPGIYQIQWNGLDEMDRPVVSGIYICKMKAGNFEKMMKMVLVQ